MNEVQRVLKYFITGLAHIVEDMDVALANFNRVYGVTDTDIRIPPCLPGELQSKLACLTVQDTGFELIEPVSYFFKQLLLAMPSGMVGLNHTAY